MSIDTTRTIEIEGSPSKLLLLALGGVLMSGLGALLAFGVISDVGIVGTMIGWSALAFFGLCTLIALWRIFEQRGPVITISPEGIRDTRVAAAFVPWRAIANISTWEFQRQRVVVLAVDPVVEKGLGLTRMAAWTRRANRSLGADGLAVTAAAVKIDFDTLLATTMAYWQAATGRAQ